MNKQQEKLRTAASMLKNALAKPAALCKNDHRGRAIEAYKVATSAKETPIWIYRPRSAPRNAPVYINLHGGGFVLGQAADDASWCQGIADAVGCAVVNIEYHLAPEYKFPAAIEECYDVAKWIYDQTEKLGFDRKRMAVGGQGSGGNIATVLCLLAQQKREFSLCFQVLNSPKLDFSIDPFYYEIQDDVLTPELMSLCADCYVQNPRDRNNPFVSPLLAKNLTGLPPALVISAEYDPLREEGELYAARLEAAGIAAISRRFSGCGHMFTHLGPEHEAREAWAMIHSHLRQAFDLQGR